MTPNILTNNLLNKVKFLAWYQILGGLLGLGITIYIIAGLEKLSGLMFLVIIVPLLLYSLSIYCGKLLLSVNYNLGFKLTIINQALQVLCFMLFGYAFMYVSGAMLLITVSSGDGVVFGFNFSIISTWQINFRTSDTTAKLGVNLVAIFMLYFADKLLLAIKKQLSDNAIDSTEAE
ncbi:hypothetical protein EOD41_06735 [Mucilaginibacter limnophilus]|uniref:Uncharacterized protein n=1 Tax=Mucilaginibacter limnophilus TaxID=1932778 RepID=A0A3S2Y4A1_9SPHI|nr:hypothetical protein [Mucilaginibacter limnophilus]RVU01651.1 hypothetical protein EOD41_06735 [Mucilaginibacter limnophilus]